MAKDTTPATATDPSRNKDLARTSRAGAGRLMPNNERSNETELTGAARLTV